MATVKFYLRSPKIGDQLRKDERPLYAKFTAGRAERFEIPLDEKIEPKFWDFKNQKVKSTYRGHHEINGYLSEFEYKLQKLYRENRELPFEQFKKLATGETLNEEKKTLVLAFEKFIKAYEVEKDSKTLAKYHTLQSALNEFSKKYEFDLKTLDFNFYDEFKAFLYAIPNPNYRSYRLVSGNSESYDFDIVHVDDLPSGADNWPAVGLLDDTVYKYIINLKAFLAWSEKRDYQVHPSYKSWKVINRRYQPISLTQDELERLEEFDLTNYKELITHTKIKTNASFIREIASALDAARSYLVFGCRTGQRISDIKRFDLKDYGDLKWTFYPKKGNRLSNKQLVVHFKGFCAPALFILQKHNWKMPVVSEQKLNKNIKNVCKIAGINTPTEIFRWAQNKKIRISGPKYEFISSHSGRKTFVTIGLQYMMPKIVKDLANMSWKTLQHYEGNSEGSTIEQALEKIPTGKTLLRKAQ